MIEAAALVVANYASVLATFHVTSTSDAGVGSLRDAISKANTAAGADTIDFTDMLFEAVPDYITLISGELLISSDIKITGTGASKLSISGNNASRAFEIASASKVTISGLSITQGSAVSVVGGGIYNLGTLTLSSSTVSGNTASGFGGSILNLVGGTSASSKSTLTGNKATNGGIYNLGTSALSKGATSM